MDRLNLATVCFDGDHRRAPSMAHASNLAGPRCAARSVSTTLGTAPLNAAYLFGSRARKTRLALFIVKYWYLMMNCTCLRQAPRCP